MVFPEAAAVTPEGRISPEDLGIWSDAHVETLARIVRFVHEQGAAAGMQIAHSGRKGSTRAPFRGVGAVPLSGNGWTPVGPTTEPFADGFPTPRALDAAEMPGIVAAFRDAARRARLAGFDVIEVHSAHGYLLHEFLSPLTNHRTDAYGGTLANRMRLCLEVVDAVRGEWPDTRPVFVRISSTDWAEGGWDIEQSVELACRLRERGVDLIDCSSGGAVSTARVPMEPGYQVPFAERIRREAGIMTGAVGLITTPQQADEIVRAGRADCVLLARELLRDPYWPLRAARELGHLVPWPPQYLRAAPTGSPGRADC
jgi:2,4-dienoyl-CoA reductase-like NADH-dependent reductase (Old Yellow Enzyme family)